MNYSNSNYSSESISGSSSVSNSHSTSISESHSDSMSTNNINHSNSDSTSTVPTNSDSIRQAFLPKTGTKGEFSIVFGNAAMAILVGLGLVKRKEDEDEELV